MIRERDPIDRHLDTLQPESASAGFTEEVMRRIEAAPSERSSLGAWRSGWAVAAAAAAVVAILVLLIKVTPADPDSPASRADRLAEMRRQHALLEQELAQLRSRAEDSAPVIYLASVDEVDYVWDLSPLLERRAGGAVPASSRPTSTPRLTKELP